MMVMPCLLVLRHVYPFKTRPITMDCSHDSVTLSLSLSLSMTTAYGIHPGPSLVG